MIVRLTEKELWQAPIAEALRRKMNSTGYKLPLTGAIKGYTRNDLDGEIGIFYQPSRSDLINKRHTI